MNISQISMRVGALFLVAAGGSGSAFAQKPPAAVADCRGIAASMERLACYDAVAGRVDSGSKEPATTLAAPVPVVSGSSVPAASNVAEAYKAPVTSSIIDSTWAFDPSSPRYDISFHNSNYLLFGRYTDHVNNAPYSPLFQAAGQPQENLNDVEAKFQISFKARLWTTDDRRWGVWAAYTQQSQWQVYNGNVSRPFRENNYMPELFVSYRPDIDLGADFNWKLLNVGYNHQSNGRSDVLSRSWDRLFATVGVERENLALYGTVWYRLPESASQDDNPNITDYYGYGELTGLYRWNGNSFKLSARGNIATGKGSVQAGWFTPPLLGPLRGYVQVFSGYGESLIDYNWNQTTIGAGVALNDGF
jgi:phospholipase A1/A2